MTSSRIQHRTINNSVSTILDFQLLPVVLEVESISHKATISILETFNIEYMIWNTFIVLFLSLLELGSLLLKSIFIVWKTAVWTFCWISFKVILYIIYKWTREVGERQCFFKQFEGKHKQYQLSKSPILGSMGRSDDKSLSPCDSRAYNSDRPNCKQRVHLI